MPKTLRLNDWEEEQIRKKATEINRLLINNNKQPLRDSELVHEILKKTISYVKVNKNGEIYLDIP